MRKQVIRTILSGFLCASGCAQSVQIAGEAPVMHLQPTDYAEGWKETLAGNFEDAWKNINNQTGWIEGRANGCARSKSRLLHIVSRGGDTRQHRKVALWQLPDSHDFF